MAIKKLPSIRPLWERVPLLARYLTAFILLLAISGGLWLNARTQARNVVRFHIGQSIYAFNDNDFDTSISQADAVLAQNAKDVDALLAKATTLAQKGSITFAETTYATQAIALAQQALTIDPKNSDAWRIIGYSYEIMQRYPEAHDAYTKSLSLNPNNVATISQNAHAWDLQGDLTQAEAGYRQALTIEPTIDQANMGLGRILLAQNKPQEALQYFTTAQQVSANVRTRAEAAYSAGIANKMLRQYDKVAPLMTQATTIDPTYSLGWVGLGTELFRQGVATSTKLTDTERNTLVNDSMNDLQRAINLNPRQSEATAEFGLQLVILGQKTPGVQMLQEAQKLIPGDITLSAPEKTKTLNTISAVLAAVEKLK